jgi:hypothetical protein
MKIMSRQELPKPLILAAGDTMALHYVEVDGVVRHEKITTIAVMRPSRAITITETIVVRTMIEGRLAIGVMMIEQPKGNSHEHTTAISPSS